MSEAETAAEAAAAVDKLALEETAEGNPAEGGGEKEENEVGDLCVWHRTEGSSLLLPAVPRSDENRRLGCLSPSPHGPPPHEPPRHTTYSSQEGKLYIGNLAFATTEEGLREAFDKFGVISFARVISDRDTGRSRCGQNCTGTG